jgi:aryl carrier-like protein
LGRDNNYNLKIKRKAEKKMNEQEKIELVAEVLDKDAAALSVDTKLSEIGWDSVGMLGVIALARMRGKKIAGADVRDLETIGQILEVVF